MFKTSFEIDQRWLIELAADRTPYIDQAQSLNLFIPADVDKWDLLMLHYRAWELGIKSLYYLRSKSVQRAGFAGGVEADNTPDLQRDRAADAPIMTNAWRASRRSPPAPDQAWTPAGAGMTDGGRGSGMDIVDMTKFAIGIVFVADRRSSCSGSRAASAASASASRSAVAVPGRRGACFVAMGLGWIDIGAARMSRAAPLALARSARSAALCRLRARRARPRSRRRRRASCSASGTASSSRSPGSLSLFMPDVAVYAVPNNGGWYDFGYFLGIVVFGVGARKTGGLTRGARARRRGVVAATGREGREQ